MKQLKVLQFICPTGYYGAERWITALLTELDKKKIRSHLCITRENDSASDVLEHCKPHCEKVHQLDMSSKFDIGVIRKLVKLIELENIDIIHTHGYKSDIIGLIAGKLAGIKTVCTPHGFENTTDRKLRTFIWFGGRFFNYFDVVCPLSPQILKDLKSKYNVKDNKIRLINNGVDLSEIRHDLEINSVKRNDELFTIGYIGQLISRKNLTSMLHAFSIFTNKFDNAKLVIIGDGEDTSLLKKLSNELGVDSKVEFKGFLDNRLQYLPSFDTFALTSSLEGIPRCLMEAMAANVCVTAFDIPGVDQLIINQETGMSFPYNDIQRLADGWLRLAKDKNLKDRLALAGKTRVETMFSAKAMAENYHNIYDQLESQKVSKA